MDRAIPCKNQHVHVHETSCMEFTWNLYGPSLEAPGLPTRANTIEMLVLWQSI